MRKLPQPAKIMERPVTFTTKKVLRFLNFYIKEDKKKNRDVAPKQLLENLANIAQCN